jgi:hypothetical protein
MHHVTGFFDERVAGVVVGEAVEEPGFGDERAEFLGLREIEGRGFVGKNRALAAGKWTWFGVTMATKSIRSPSGRADSAFIISSKLP